LVITAGIISLVNMALTPDKRARLPIPILITPRDPKEILDQDPIEDCGLGLAQEFMPPIHDPSSLRELREAIQTRARLGLVVLQAESEQTRLRFRAPKEEVAAAAKLLYQISLLNLYEGRYAEAATALQAAMNLGRPVDIPIRDRARRAALLGIIALRQGEA